VEVHGYAVMDNQPISNIMEVTFDGGSSEVAVNEIEEEQSDATCHSFFGYFGLCFIQKLYFSILDKGKKFFY